ncbi:hypothetical protein RJ640_024088 [Escallonia rubra]|uniref:Disease resistance R13L4/SHOC-2-like LRR domain-containing protein n=1 Tax=Escallonia rubra TaxID=112253 RepID=A0AA88RJK8_9ASTE|nr:hypothetical protein RJ640_024088 [Escallonia rubra]
MSPKVCKLRTEQESWSEKSCTGTLRLEMLKRPLLMSPKRDHTMQMASAEDKSSYSYVVNDNIVNDSTTWHARPGPGHIGQNIKTHLAREGLLGPLAKDNLQRKILMCIPCDEDEPISVEEALSSSVSNEWMATMKDVVSSIEKNQNLRTIRVEEDVTVEGDVTQGCSQSFVDTCVSRFQCLRILDLRNSIFETLPRSIGGLKHLKYLDISWNGNLKSLPTSLCKLQSLQTLQLEGCWELKELPRDFGDLISLRCLGLTTLCHEEGTRYRYFSMFLWIMDDAVSQGMSRKTVGSYWNDMRALGRKSNITPCYVIHSPVNFINFSFDMNHEYITYERFNTAHYEGFESV